MQTPLQNTQKFNFDDFTTFTEKIKKNTQKSIDKMKNEIKNEMKNEMQNINLKMGNLENKIEK